jgi:hypothetical protein
VYCIGIGTLVASNKHNTISREFGAAFGIRHTFEESVLHHYFFVVIRFGRHVGDLFGQSPLVVLCSFCGSDFASGTQLLVRHSDKTHLKFPKFHNVEVIFIGIPNYRAR